MVHPWQLMLVVCLSIRISESVVCERILHIDACQFKCNNGNARNVALKVEQLWRNNPTCRLFSILLTLGSTIEYDNFTLHERWYQSLLPVLVLDIDVPQITSIESGAFVSAAFRNTTTLVIRHLPKTIHLQIGIFGGLTALRQLFLIDLRTINITTPQLLNIVGPTLEHLHVSEQANPSNTLPHNLNGLTSNINAPAMPALREIVYMLNLNGTIGARTFSGLRAVETLRLAGCSIEHLAVGTFDPLVGTLKCLDLRSNRLRQLPAGIFDRLLGQPRVSLARISLDGNPWDCRCGLAYVQFHLRAHTSAFTSPQPMCRTPSSVAGELVEKTRFCVNGKDVIFEKVLRCWDETATALTETEIAFRQNHFRVRHTSESTTRTSTIDVERARPVGELPWLLIRFAVDGWQVPPKDPDDEHKSLQCIWGRERHHRLEVRHSAMEQQQQQQLLCMLNKTHTGQAETISPLDCTAVYLPPNHNVTNTTFSSDHTWLTQQQKPFVATVLAFVMVGCFGIGLIIICAISYGMQCHKDAKPIIPCRAFKDNGTKPEVQYEELAFECIPNSVYESSIDVVAIRNRISVSNRF